MRAMSSGSSRWFRRSDPSALRFGTCAVFGAMLVFMACVGAHPPAAQPPAPPADTTATPPAEPTASASESGVSDNPPPAQATPPEQVKPESSPRELCQKMCDRLKDRCSADL